MPGITRTTLDSAGGIVTSTPQAFVRCEGQLVAVVGALVAPHGTGSHAIATLPNGSVFCSINGLAVILAGKAASCGHTASGSSFASCSA